MFQRHFRSPRFALSALLALGFATVSPLRAEDPHAAHADTGVSADDALHRLMEGNHRFIEGHRTASEDDVHRRAALASSQKPFAVIVACSDSRVGPEIIFDQGLGDLFVVRSAGQVLSGPSLGSVEYAVDHLGAQLVVVLGHERCGAVSAALAGGDAPGHIADLVKAIQPAVEKSKDQPGDKLDNAIAENVREEVQMLNNDSPILTDFLHKGTLKVVGATYNLDTGEVKLVP